MARRRLSTRTRSAATSPAVAPRAGAPLLNRVTQGLYAPGSTFKVGDRRRPRSTAASSRRRPLIDAKRPLHHRQGHPLCNAGGESVGVVTLADALTFSYNTVFAQVGQQVGQTRLEEYDAAFGFFPKPPLDYPCDEMEASAACTAGTAISAAGRAGGRRPGGDRPGAAAGDADADGRGRRHDRKRRRADAPDAWSTGWSRPSGETVYTQHPEQLERVMSPQTAPELTGMMRKRCRGGHRAGRRTSEACRSPARPGPPRLESPE